MYRRTPPHRPPCLRPSFAERLCAFHQQPLDQFSALAWQHGATWTTRILRSAIVRFAPRYFEAEDLHLERAGECRCRRDVAEEMDFLRVSYLRRGGWRLLGIGVNGARLLRHYDRLIREHAGEPETGRPVERRNCPQPETPATATTFATVTAERAAARPAPGSQMNQDYSRTA